MLCTIDPYNRPVLGPFSNAIDFIKPLQWLPTKTKRRGFALRDGFYEVYGNMLADVKKKMDEGAAVPDCLGKTLIENQKKEDLSWEDMTMIVNAFTTGGVPSVRSSILTSAL